MKLDIALLPLEQEIESKKVLKQLASTHKQLALLEGRSAIIPNKNILISTLSLQEAKESSAIENIITTHDEIYKAAIVNNLINDVAVKEVTRYSKALVEGYNKIKDDELITNNLILEIQKMLVLNNAGYRRNPGTVLKNERTGEVVFTPPQSHDEILKLMNNLMEFINNKEVSNLDPLIKMAIIHHRFETIHPFYDGNGRTGRIINILYLVQQNLLSLPILYLSRYIIQYKGDYYSLLQRVRDKNEWEDWILFMLRAVEETSKQTLYLIEEIKRLMQDYKMRIREEFPRIYSQDLLNNLFKHPYTKIEFLENDLGVTRQTASSYLNRLDKSGYLHKTRIGKSNYYINKPLYNLLAEGVPSAQAYDNIKTVHEGEAYYEVKSEK